MDDDLLSSPRVAGTGSLEGAVPAGGPGTATPASEPPASSSKVRSRLARFGTRTTVVSPALEPLLMAVRANHPKADLAVLERAYAVAEQAHRGQLRKSGDPYITHPVAVATILADLGMTTPTLAAIEQGRGLITLDDMQQLARGLGVRVGVLLGE